MFGFGDTPFLEKDIVMEKIAEIISVEEQWRAAVLLFAYNGNGN